MIGYKLQGDFSKTENFLDKIKRNYVLEHLDKYGQLGVEALSAATPVDSGLTASSWSYTITRTRTSATITFHNSNIQNGVPIAIILQYGHATRNGGYVQGRDYINPAIQPIFDDLAAKAWGEVTKL